MDPGDLVKQAHDAGALTMLQVTTVAQAVQAAERGIDVIIAQGGESGGYCGEVSTMTLVPQVVDAVSPIPVVAAGGIFDGRGIAAALMLGAAGVNMGTRFIACMEAPAPAEWKRAITQAKSEDARSRSTSSTTSVRCRGRSVSAPFRAPCARPSWMSGAASARRRVASAIVCAIRSL